MDINSTLEKYIFEEVVPRYASFDAAHKEDHALTVIRQALELLDGRGSWAAAQADVEPLWLTPVSRAMLMTAAACHDLGLVNGRERHHLDSGIIIRADSRLKEWFNEEQIEIIAQAAEDHRASGKGAPRSIYGMLIAEADRVIDQETIIRRTIQFGLKHYPDLCREGQLQRAKEHLVEKYGRGGYLRLWIPWSSNAARLNALQDLIADPDALEHEVTRIYDSL
ncbi:MAG: HD domain-containing protein [Bacteroidales bacterium]|nr:HD domain-containing protein [Bacteroidales bacterium]